MRIILHIADSKWYDGMIASDEVRFVVHAWDGRVIGELIVPDDEDGGLDRAFETACKIVKGELDAWRRQYGYQHGRCLECGRTDGRHDRDCLVIE